MTRYDNLPARDARRAATQTLALAKWVLARAADVAKPLEAEAKEWLAENDLDPGMRLPALIDGDEVATISRSKIADRQNIIVEDEEAFGEWLVKNGHENPFQVRLHDWAKQPSFLEAVVVKAEGEVPDGVIVSTRRTGGTVSIRQSDAQRENLEKHIEALQAITDTFDALGALEAGEAA